MRGRIVAAAGNDDDVRTYSLPRFRQRNTSCRGNFDPARRTSSFLDLQINPSFAWEKEAGVLRDENDFYDMMFCYDDMEVVKEKTFTSTCFKTGSDRDVFVGTHDGEVKGV